ncbi:hypothetical protein Tco_1355283 [Tanacetum coccineum]
MTVNSELVHNCVGVMEEEPDIENMTLEEYLKYESEKIEAFEYPDSDEEIVDDVYYQLPLLKTCFQASQPYTKSGFVSPNENDEVDIDSIEEVLDDFVKIEAKNLRRMKQEKVQENECDEENMDEIWDIIVKDVERLKQLLTHTVQALPKPVVQLYVLQIQFPNEVKVSDLMQPCTSQTIHTTPLDDAYVVQDTKLFLEKLLEEFSDELLDIIVVDKEAVCNPTRDKEELEHLLAIDHESSFTEIKAFLCIVKTNV